MSGEPRDYFTIARSWAATGLFVAGGLAVIGPFLSWVTITDIPSELPAAEAGKAVPFTGIALGSGYFRDGWMVIAGGILLVLAAVLLVLRGSTGHAWFGFVVSIFIGAIAIADFRGIDQSFFTEMDRVGNPQPGIGLILVAISGLLGLVSSVAGAAATPRRD